MNDFSWPDPPRQTAFPVARAGYPFIFSAAFVTAVFALLGIVSLALVCLVISLFVCYFFRDPDRVVPNVPGAVVSPADGKVVAAEMGEDSPFYKGKYRKISIFMSVFNVHVNRVAHEGKITGIDYHPGKFLSANLDKASKENEHNAVFLETENGARVCMVQIAGLIARRIICAVRASETVRRGQRFGLICFGSRVDVYLPADTRLNLSVGDRVQAGTTIVGYLP